MSTTTTSNGNAIKAAINGKSLAQLREECIIAHSKYQSEIKSRFAPTGATEVIYDFLGCGDYEDSIHEYQCLATDLLKALSRPEVNAMLLKVTSEWTMEQLPELLGRLIQVTAIMNDSEYFLAEMTQYHLEQYTDENTFTAERWIEKKEEYERKCYAEQMLKGKIQIGV